MVIVPTAVSAYARAAGARDWLDELPALVADLEVAWSITVGRTYDDATEAFVAQAVMDDGTAAVLKLVPPGRDRRAQREITMLRLADGSGCVRLLRDDSARGAMLLERLGRSLSELGLPMVRRHEILCDVATRVWRPVDADLLSGADEARSMGADIVSLWERFDRPCSEAAVQQALDCVERRIAAHDDATAVLVHGDVHQWNTLEAGSGFKLVDPDGLSAEREYDLGVLMREDPLELMHGDPHERSRWLAARTRLDERAIWEWGVLGRLTNGLFWFRDGDEERSRMFLSVTDHIAATDDQ